MAEGRRQAHILASEAEKTEQIYTAEGKADALGIVCEALEHQQGKGFMGIFLGISR